MGRMNINYPVTSHQSPVTSPQSPVTSHQSPVPSLVAIFPAN
ncbi:Na+-transporting NADH:ubiquinone oxidoreductase, subunit NqrB, partial [Sphaerospermopsis sp. LEGE 00249]|nr:Na+-transporting NADH:ubiquinone oxidoreductase, subunit NqrB [Sphaerospermopsis sp. LEGE 00249]